MTRRIRQQELLGIYSTASVGCYIKGDVKSETVPALVFICGFLFYPLLRFFPFYCIYLSTSFTISNTSSPKTFDKPKSITFKGLSSSFVKNRKFSGFKSLKIVFFFLSENVNTYGIFYCGGSSLSPALFM